MARALFQCDQCTYEEWRDASESVTLCPVCGYMRWEMVATAADPEVETGDGDEATDTRPGS